MSKYHTRLEVNGVEDVPVIVDYTFYPFCAGSTDGRHGPKIEPDEPAHIEIDGVKLAEDGREIELSEYGHERLEEEIGEYLYDRETRNHFDDYED